MKELEQSIISGKLENPLISVKVCQYVDYCVGKDQLVKSCMVEVPLKIIKSQGQLRIKDATDKIHMSKLTN